MYQGNWKCSGCRGVITELPFQPRSESGLTCRTCYAKGREADKKEQPVPEMQTANEPMDTNDVPDFDESSIATEPPPFDGMGTNAPAETSEKPKFEGDWQCSVCSGSITFLPFQPRNTSNLKCLECFKQSKGQ